MTEVVIRVEWSAAECERLYRYHGGEWRKAKAEMDALPWWRLFRRATLHTRYRVHLNRAALFSECLVMDTEVKRCDAALYGIRGGKP